MKEKMSNGPRTVFILPPIANGPDNGFNNSIHNMNIR